MKWTSIHDGRPDGSKPYIVWTKNGKVMSVADRMLDEWFISKYAVTHWMIPDSPQDVPTQRVPPVVYNFIEQLSMDGVVPVQLGETMDEVALRRFKIRIDQARVLLKEIRK